MITSFSTYANHVSRPQVRERDLGASAAAAATRTGDRGLKVLRVNDFALATRCVR